MIRRNRNILVTTLLLALGLGVGPGGASAEEGPRWHSAHGILSLDVDPRTVVASGQSLPEALATSTGTLRGGVGPAGLHPGQRAYRLDRPGRANVEAAARALASRPGVDWASPLYEIGATPLLVAGRGLARFMEDSDPAEEARRVGLRLQGRHAPGIWYLVSPGSSASEIVEATARLVEEGRALWAEPEFLFRIEARYTPDDAIYTSQWHLDNQGQQGGTPDLDVNAPEGWDAMPADARLGHPDVVIAVIDGGIFRDHEDLADNIWINEDEVPGNGTDDDGNLRVDDTWGWDFVDNDNDPTPPDICDDHGVSVAGVAAARGDNGLGVTGACGACRIMTVRLLDQGGFFGATLPANSIRYAARNGAAIINNSWGPSDAVAPLPNTLKDAIDFAVDFGRGGLGSTIFWSAGNSALDGHSVDTDEWSSYDRVITVGAINDDGERSRYSEPGEDLDLVAPSNDLRAGRAGITTTQTGQVRFGNCVAGNYDTAFGGTSSASPLAAGVGGLVLSAVPRIRPAKLQRILEENAYRDFLLPTWIATEHGKGAVRMDAPLADVMAGPTLDRLAYECVDHEILVSVRDAGASGSVEVLVTSDWEPQGERITADEVPGRPGLFEAALPTEWDPAPVAGDGVLVVGPQGTVTAEYAGIQDTASSSCNEANCFLDPEFAGLKRVEDSADCSGRGPTLYWDPAPSWGSGGPRFYNIYRSTTPDLDPDTTSRHFAVLSDVTEWSDLLADPGVTYYYAVRAENDETGCGGPSGGMEEDNRVVLSGRTGADDVQGPVTGLRLSKPADDPHAVDLDWDPVADALTYDVFRADFGPDPFAFAPACWLGDQDPAAAIRDDQPTPGAARGSYYLVTVVGSCGSSAFGAADVPRPAPDACP